MSTEVIDPNHYYYQLNDFLRVLPDSAFVEIGIKLMIDIPGRGWKALGDKLGYAMQTLEGLSYVRPGNCGYTLLEDWSKGRAATVLVLDQALKNIGRHDIVTILDEIRRNPILLYLQIIDRKSSGATVEVANIKGRRKLWEGLLPCLQEHVQKVGHDKAVTYFRLDARSMNSISWQDCCNSYLGQQLNIEMTHEDNYSATFKNVRRLIPSWDLLTDILLRFTRARINDHVASNGEIQQISTARIIDEESVPVLSSPHQESTNNDLSLCQNQLEYLDLRRENYDLRSTDDSSTNPCNFVIKNESLSDLSVENFQETLVATRPESTRRRRVYYFPDIETLKRHIPELTNIPGFHGELKPKNCLIKRFMAPYMKENGRYLIRVFALEDDKAKILIALGVIHNRRIKHFRILHRHDVTSARLYFLFVSDFEAASISELVDHYKRHPLIERESNDDSNFMLTQPIYDH